MNEDTFELRSEEVQDILTKVPHWMIRWGTVLIFTIIVMLFFVSWFVKYPDVVKTEIVNGTYYLENLYQGFYNPAGADSSAPNNSQAFLTAVATRALIFIEADNPAIGLMCVMPVGMAEVSSCEIKVQAGDVVKKGDELGMFHFGGSTHCLIFRPGVELAFIPYETDGLDAPNNIRVNTQIAKVI